MPHFISRLLNRYLSSRSRPARWKPTSRRLDFERLDERILPSITSSYSALNNSWSLLAPPPTRIPAHTVHFGGPINSAAPTYPPPTPAPSTLPALPTTTNGWVAFDGGVRIDTQDSANAAPSTAFSSTYALKYAYEAAWKQIRPQLDATISQWISTHVQLLPGQQLYNVQSYLNSSPSHWQVQLDGSHLGLQFTLAGNLLDITSRQDLTFSDPFGLTHVQVGQGADPRIWASYDMTVTAWMDLPSKTAPLHVVTMTPAFSNIQVVGVSGLGWLVTQAVGTYRSAGSPIFNALAGYLLADPMANWAGNVNAALQVYVNQHLLDANLWNYPQVRTSYDPSTNQVVFTEYQGPNATPHWNPDAWA